MLKASWKSAVVIIPPKDDWKQIEDVRRIHDKAFCRWMPHINLIFPFYMNSQNCFELESTKLCKALGDIEPFRILFSEDSFGEFAHGHSATIYLKPLEPSCPQQNVDPINLRLKPEGKKKKQVKVKQKKVKPKKVEVKWKISDTSEFPSLASHPERANCIPNLDNRSSIPSLDNLSSAVWLPGKAYSQPIGEQLHSKPGLDCLRFAYWTPDNDDFSMVAPTTFVPEVDCVKSANKSIVSSLSESDTESESSSISDSSSLSSDIGHFPYLEESTTPDFRKPHTKVMNLQAVLQNIYPNLNEQSKKSAEGFKPHLTLGQESLSKKNRNLTRSVKSNWKDIEFDVNEIHLISRKDDFSRFEIIQSIPLGAFSSK